MPMATGCPERGAVKGGKEGLGAGWSRRRLTRAPSDPLPRKPSVRAALLVVALAV